MGVSIEPLVFAVRVGEKHEKYGDPYSGSLTVVKHGDLAEIVARIRDDAQQV